MITSELLYYGWVMFGLAFVVLMIVVFVPFLIRLELRTRLQLLLSGLLYFGGSLGMEMLNADLHSAGESGTVRYGLQSGLEEMLELLGASVLLFTVLDVLARSNAVFALSVSSSGLDGSEPVECDLTTGRRCG